MTKSEYALGIDFGTESGRVMLVRLSNGEEAASSVIPYRNGVIDRKLPGGRVLEPEWALQDPRDYLAVLAEGIPAVLRQSGAAPESIAGIGVDFTSCTMLPALADGTPLCALNEYAGNPHAWVKLWKHHAAQPEANRINELAATRGEDFLEVYGGKISSEWFLPKALQILNEAPEIYAAADRLIEAADWIVWRMTGEERRSECTAGYKGTWIKGQGFPSQDFLRALHPELGTLTGKLSLEQRPLGSVAGGLSAEMAHVTGLRAGTPVAVAAIDAHSAVPACGVSKPGTLVMIMGTSICHMMLSSERRLVEGISGVIEDGIVPGLWGYEAGQSGFGDIYAWFFRTFGVPPETITEQAMRLRPGESGLIALDWWNGNRSVLANADLTGVLLGATLATRPEHIYRALVEATAFGTLTVIRAFEKEGVAIEELVACGGIARKSPLVMQIFSDVTNRPIRLPRATEASGVGAAMHAAVAAGAYPSFTAAAERMAGREAKEYQPDAAAHAVYQKLYEEYLTLHDYFGRGVNDCMKRLRALRPNAIC